MAYGRHAATGRPEGRGPEGEEPERAWRACGPGLEIARPADGGLLVRAAGDAEGPVLHYTPAEVAAFVSGVRDGEFDDLAAAGPPDPPRDQPGRAGPIRRA